MGEAGASDRGPANPSRGQAGAEPDPGAPIRSRSYRVLLVFAAVIGVVVSLASWGFLELIHRPYKVIGLTC